MKSFFANFRKNSRVFGAHAVSGISTAVGVPADASAVGVPTFADIPSSV